MHGVDGLYGLNAMRTAARESNQDLEKLNWIQWETESHVKPLIGQILKVAVRHLVHQQRLQQLQHCLGLSIMFLTEMNSI